MKTIRGFTLFELLITLVIVVIIATFSIQAVNAFWQKAEGDIVRRGILTALDLARVTAMTQHEIVSVCKSADQLTCGGSWQQGLITKINQKLLYAIDFTNNFGIVLSRFFPRGREVLSYLPTGQSEIQNGTFWYCVKNKKYPSWAIVLNRTSRAREVFPNENGLIVDSHGEILVCE